MIILISAVTIVLYIILFLFTAHNLNPIIEVKKKIVFIVVGIIVMLIATLIVFAISSSGIQYESPEMIRNVRKVMLAVFVPVNGMIAMPYLASIASKIYTHNITQEKVKKRFVIISIVFIIVLIFECSYFRTTQIGIINLINHM